MTDTGLLPSFVVACLLVAATCVTLFMTTRRPEDLPLQVRFFLGAFALRFAVSIALYQFGVAQMLGDEDSSGWTVGALLHESWVQQHVELWELPAVLARAFEGHNAGYKYLIGALFYLTDAPFRLTAAALNSFFGALTVVFVWRATRSLFSQGVAIRVAWWLCIFPSMIIWSAQTVKEPVVICLETIALYGCIRLRQLGLSLPHLLLCAAATILLLPFRFYAGYIVGAAVAITLLLRTFTQARSGIAGAALLAVVIPLVLCTGIFARHEVEFERFDLNRVQQFRSDVATGGRRAGAGSGVHTDDIRTSSGLVGGVLIGGAHLLLAPFPWQLSGASLRMALTFPELLFWWWLFFAGVIPGLKHALRHRLLDVTPMLLHLLGFGLLYSMLFGNVGLAFRQRAQLLPWLLIFGAVGLEQRAIRALAVRRRRLAVSSVLAARR